MRGAWFRLAVTPAACCGRLVGPRCPCHPRAPALRRRFLLCLRFLPLQRFPLMFSVGIFVFRHEPSLWPLKPMVRQSSADRFRRGGRCTAAPALGQATERLSRDKANGSAAIQETSAAGRPRATRSEDVWREAEGFAVPSPLDNHSSTIGSRWTARFGVSCTASSLDTARGDAMLRLFVTCESGQARPASCVHLLLL